MATVKIISNPYKKEVCFQKQMADGEWGNINATNNPNSKLIRTELTTGFFPFKAHKIVTCITEEYSVPGEELNLVFEGSDDEYHELQEVCREKLNDITVTVQRGGSILENARDILPEVKKLFQEMNPLILQSIDQEEIQNELNRFEDASSDVVPICVLGNYSSGKSTFINALIGGEILPNGSEPVTAKIYRIARSKYRDRARITFEYCGNDARITFTEHDKSIEDLNNTVLLNELTEALDRVGEDSISVRVSTALGILNAYEDSTEEQQISDLIRVEVPFSNGVLSRTQHPFVIFDTPGSNSASNAKHLAVLKQAMANMTNGLPIFLSTPDALDSTDNENLYEIIRTFEELDDRFTMIVVNKADAAGSQRRMNAEQDQRKILSQAVPRNLYSGGLFYVSSIIGLGAKTDGQFEDADYDDVFNAQSTRYQDPNSKYYRTLYRYNIMPPQIKARADQLAAEQSDLIYANSGLFSIETEIETFAGKYAAYNKCFQSQMFLKQIISRTEVEIENKKKEREEDKREISEKLEEDKKQLRDHLQNNAEESRAGYDSKYLEYMAPFLKNAEGAFSEEELFEKNRQFIVEQEEGQNFGEHTEHVEAAKGFIRENLRANAGNVFKDKKFNIRAIGDAVSDLRADVGAAFDTAMMRRAAKHEVDKAAADQLLDFVMKEFEEKLSEHNSVLDAESKAYWTDRTEALRDQLAAIVSGSEILTEDRRQELESIILTFNQIEFSDDAAENIFNKDNFQKKVQFGELVLWESDHLDLHKLVRTYNRSMKENVASRYQWIEISHRESAHNWISSLLEEINTNIVKYSPELSKKQERVLSITREIKGLVARQEKLKNYTSQLVAMMDWKTI